MGSEDDACIASFTGSLLSRLPLDVHLHIVSFLPLRDLCALGRCSRYWRESCRSDSVWSSRFRKRWPSLFKLLISQSDQSVVIEICPSPTRNPISGEIEDWMSLYHKRHTEIYVLGLLKTSRSGCKLLAKYRYSFTDVVHVSFLNYARMEANMAGILYAIKYLKVPRKLVAKALRVRNIHQKKVFGNKSERMCRILVPSENLCSDLTLEEVALGRRRVQKGNRK